MRRPASLHAVDADHRRRRGAPGHVAARRRSTHARRAPARDDRVRRQRPRPFRAAGDFRRAVGARRGEHRDVDRRPARRVARTRRRSAVRAALLDGSRRSQPAPGGTEVPPQYSSRSRAGDALVAYEMNGQPVPFLHGGPLRLVVPRWFGMASTKWLTHVHARPTESDNHFMVRGYRYADGSAVDLMRVKSLITAPRDGEKWPLGTARVSGVAWTGSGTIAKVEISSDDGRTWQEARCTSEPRPGAWRLWEADVTIPSAGEQRVRARATDTAGADTTRPRDPESRGLRKQFDPGGACHCLLMPRFARRFACRRRAPPHEGRSSPRSSRPSSSEDAEAPVSTARLFRIRH